MKKKYIVALLACSMTALVLTGCANPTDQGSETTAQNEIQQNEDENVQQGEDVENQQDDSELAKGNEEEFSFSYKKLAGREFYFSSGAGGWDTTFTINADGTFSGQYHDADMGDTGAGYPDGTLYQCLFDGKFGDLEKVDELTYRTTIAEIHYEKEAGTDEIVNDLHMVYTEPYGLENSSTFEFYLPGTKVSDLSEEYVGWIYWDILDFETQEKATELPFYGFCNVDQQYGFSSYDVVERYEDNLKYTVEYADSLEKSIENDDLTQVEYNDKAKELYDIWDREINSLWSLLREKLPQEKMETLTAEQREWVQKKEEAVKQISAQYEGGSMQPMQEDLEAARLTKERFYELLKLLD